MAVLGVQSTRIKSVRRLANNIKVAEMSDADIVERIETTDTWMQTETRKFDWVTTDTMWLSALYASDLMAAADILSGIPRDLATKQAGDHRVAARDTIKAVNKKDIEIQNNGRFIVSAGVNITDELESDNYVPEESDS